MLSFFRENSLKIILVIVISFVVTTFLGAVFFNQSSSSAGDRSAKDLSEYIAMIGPDIGVLLSTYGLELDRIKSSIENPEVLYSQIDQIKYIAFLRAIEHSLILYQANIDKVPVKKREINDALIEVMAQFEVNSVKELKKKMIELEQPYNQLIIQVSYHPKLDLSMR